MAVPNVPDYSQYIARMTEIGNQGVGRSGDLYDWAKTQGAKLQDTADAAGTKAGTLADATLPTDPRLMAEWEKTYMPLYKAQAADASRMIGELPNTEESYAGKFAADTAQSMDASKAQQQRTLQGYGLKRPGIASAALDATSANQRAAATAAASETGRLAARSEARGVTGQAIQTGTQIPAVGAQQATIGQQANQQQVALPATAMTTTAAGFSPSLGYMQASYPYLSQWGSTMANSYNQQLAGFNAGENAGGGTGALMGAGIGALGQLGAAAIMAKEGGVIKKYANGGIGGDDWMSGAQYPGDPLYGVWEGLSPDAAPTYDQGEGIGSSIGGTVGGIAGSAIGGPIGHIAGREIGQRAGAGVGAAVQGNWGEAASDITAGTPLTFFFDEGGQPHPVTPPGNANFVPPSASPSKGAITDDVPARLNAGEFVLPKDVVSWMGEEKLQKLIQSMRQKRQEGEIAKPEMGAAAGGGAINMRAPTFISEGARV